MDEARHDPDLALAGGDDARAVGTHEPGLRLRLQHACEPHHVVLGDPLGDADDEGNFGGDGFFDAGGGDGGSGFFPD